jgi:cobalt-zinc-cadmium efflux system protein
MHGHGDDHGHGAARATRPFAFALLANLAYTAVEAGFGWHAHSLALLSDALHNFGDALGLALAWGAARLALRPPTARHTYGWRRATLLSPLANAVLLVAFSGALIAESLRRFADPGLVPGQLVMLVAAIGIGVNLGSAALLHRGQAGDLNRRGAYLHLLADAAVSAAAVLAGLGMSLLGWRCRAGQRRGPRQLPGRDRARPRRALRHQPRHRAGGIGPWLRARRDRPRPAPRPLGGWGRWRPDGKRPRRL